MYWMILDGYAYPDLAACGSATEEEKRNAGWVEFRYV
jgi:hypothetical protein